MRSLVFVMVCAAVAAGQDLPEGWVLDGECEVTAERHTAMEAATVSGPVHAPRRVEFVVSLGRVDVPLIVRAEGEGKDRGGLTLTAKDLPQSPWGWKKEIVRDAGVAALLRQPGQPYLFRQNLWIRPNPHFHHRNDLKRTLDGWDKLPPATAHRLRVRVEAGPTETAFWLDDRFVGRLDLQAKALVLAMGAGNSLFRVSVGALQSYGRYVPIRLAGYRRAGRPGATTSSVAPGPRDIGGVPFEVAAPTDSIDVGLSRWLMESVGPDDFTDDYFTRSAFDGTPESVLLAVPAGEYSHVHLLCAVDPDPAKAPVLTLRLTRFLKDMYDSGGRGDGIADTPIRLVQAGDRWPDGVEVVGEVALDTAQGRKEAPLLHVRARLDSGHIQDLLDEKGFFYGRSTQGLDLELTKEVRRVAKQNYANFSTKPLGRPSAVRVFGLTLERSPVRVRLVPKRVGNVFYASEGPALPVRVSNVSGAALEAEVTCDITDIEGSERRVTEKVALAPGEETVVRLDVGGPAVGWFGARMRVVAGGEVLWEIPTSFAILPPDTRKGRAASPFGVWWFRRSHVGTDSVAEVAPLLHRMGVFRVSPGGRGPSGAELAEHDLAISMFPNIVRSSTKDPDAAVAALVKQHPDVRAALIFHESGFGEKIVYPPEFIGREPRKLTEEQEQRLKSLWDKAVAVSRAYRRSNPDIRLIVGNSSLPFIAEFLRRGYPRDLVDALGNEETGQLMMPETQPQSFKSVYWLKEYAERYKYDVPITTTYEWRYRPTTPGSLTELEQAELVARDALQALAYGMPHINPGLLHDVGDAYFYSRWGGTGFCHRYPLLHPKPSYVAMATLTRELDGMEAEAYFAGPSPSLHILLLEGEKGRVYALWLPRGERQVTLTFDGEAGGAVTGMLGRPVPMIAEGRAATLTVSSSPCYLRTSAKIVGAEVGPTTCEPPPADTRVVDDLCGAGRWSPATEPDMFLETAHFDFPRHQGKFALAVAADAEKGRALDVKLLPQPAVPAPCPRYLILEPREPVPVPGEPRSLGLWVKGNSCWGRVIWEFQDAKGETFSSISAGEGGWMVGDWRARTFINFDGWNYLRVRLLTWHESGFYGPERRHWRCTGGDGRVDFPIRVTRLIVEMRDRVVHLTDMVPVPNPAIRVRDLSASYE